MRKQDMQRIFNDEWSESGQIWPNPFGTKPILPLDIVANRLKWSGLCKKEAADSGQNGPNQNHQDFRFRL
jgi:hypothetical protein